MWPKDNVGSNLCTDSYEPVYSMLTNTWKKMVPSSRTTKCTYVILKLQSSNKLYEEH